MRRTQLDKTFSLKPHSPDTFGTMYYLFSERKMDPELAKDLPEVGFIAFDDGIPVAAGFLRRVEGGYSLLDGLISNPNCRPWDRHVCIDLVVQELIKTAVARDDKKIVAYSEDISTINRSFVHGFKKLPHSLICLDLNAGG